MTYPFGTYLNPDSEIEQGRYFTLMHFVMINLVARQSMFFLKLDKESAKFIRLFNQSFKEMSAFLSIFVILGIMTGLEMHVLGATFDDGGNFGDDYDTDHNDYELVRYYGVVIIATIRNAIGDLQPPTYDYWVGHYRAGGGIRDLL